MNVRILAGAASLLLAAAGAIGFAPAHPFAAQKQQLDLRYMERELLQHPMFAVHPAKEMAFKRFAAGLIARAGQPLSRWRFFLLADRMANWFHDPHTNVGITAASLGASDAYLPVSFFWTPQGLVAIREPGAPAALRTGDVVTSISGVPATSLPQRLRRYFSGNRYWLKSPFVAEQLSFAPLLHWLGAVGPRGAVTLTLRRGRGADYRVRVQMLPFSRQELAAVDRSGRRLGAHLLLPAGLKWTRGRTWEYAVTPRYGFFFLGACVDDPAYERAVNAFFSQVAAARAPNVVLDLQTNGGGNSAVMNAWLAHLPPAYAQTDHVPVDRAANVFDGHVYVLQSGDTFSSAMMLDDALTGPGLGVRVGTPVGEATGGWGDVRGYTLPHSGIYFQVSTSYIAPVKGSVQPTLMPQIPLALTAQDFRRQVSPVTRFVAMLGDATAPN